MPTTATSLPAGTAGAEPDDAWERQVADFWASYAASGRRGVAHLLRHPWRSTRMIRGLLRLPVLNAAPSSSPGGRSVRSVLSVRGPLGGPARWLGSAVLVVPADPDHYLAGRSAQTLRRKIRSAEKLGVSCQLVADREERLALLAMANEAERAHADPRYRVPAPDNEDLLEHDLWMKAVDRDGRPLLLAVIPVDGEFAVLRYFRTLGAGPEHSDSRYLATSRVVRELASHGVRYLLDTEAPGAQTNGLRHFQRMVGFRYLRIRLQRRSEPVAALSLSAT